MATVPSSKIPPSGPRQLDGRLGCLFFAIFFGAGCAFLALMIGTIVWPEWRAQHVFVEHTCIVLDKRVAETHGKSTSYRPEIHIQYSVDGQEYRLWTYDAVGGYSSGRAGKQEIIDQFVVGRQYPCWYDPESPGKAVLVLGYSWLMYLFLLLPLLFIAIGGGGMRYFWKRRGKSSEELAAASEGGTTGDLLPRFPTVPYRDLSNSPGVTLRYRLPISTTPGCTLAGTLGLAVFWNGIISVFVVIAVQGHLRGQPEWILSVVILPFVAIGLILVGLFIRQFFITISLSTAQVEIGVFPVVAGEAVGIQVSQPGPLRARSLKVLLVCDETATYTPGTRRSGHAGNNTRTETTRVYEHTVAEETELVVSRDMPWEFRGDIQVPRGAMHSFEASHNKVVWKLLVKGRVERWPSFEWEYPLIVQPAGGNA